VVNPTKAGRDPLGWLAEAGTVLAASVAELPGLVDYVYHPNGRPARMLAAGGRFL
jgi:hypothetical protein